MRALATMRPPWLTDCAHARLPCAQHEWLHPSMTLSKIRRVREDMNQLGRVLVRCALSALRVRTAADPLDAMLVPLLSAVRTSSTRPLRWPSCTSSSSWRRSAAGASSCAGGRSTACSGAHACACVRACACTECGGQGEPQAGRGCVLAAGPQVQRVGACRRAVLRALRPRLRTAVMPARRLRPSSLRVPALASHCCCCCSC